MAYLSRSPLVVAQGGTGLTSITAHKIIIGNGTGTPSLLTPSATSGVPLISQGVAADPVYGTAVVSGGGTGGTTFTAYSVITAGTTATGNFQNVVGVGTAGQALVSAGAGALPVWTSLTSPALAVTTVNNAASPYTVLAGDQFLSVDCSAGAVSILMPNSTTTGRVLYVKDVTGNAATNNITVTTVGGAVLIDTATTYVINTAFQSVDTIFTGTNYFLF